MHVVVCIHGCEITHPIIILQYNYTYRAESFWIWKWGQIRCININVCICIRRGREWVNVQYSKITRDAARWKVLEGLHKRDTLYICSEHYMTRRFCKSDAMVAEKRHAVWTSDRMIIRLGRVRTVPNGICLISSNGHNEEYVDSRSNCTFWTTNMADIGTNQHHIRHASIVGMLDVASKVLLHSSSRAIGDFDQGVNVRMSTSYNNQHPETSQRISSAKVSCHRD